MKGLVVILSVVALAVWEGGNATTTNAQNVHIQCPGIVKGVKFYKHNTWKYQDRLRINRTRASKQKSLSCKYSAWKASLWRHRSKIFFHKWLNYLKQKKLVLALPPHDQLWECIHEGEADWFNHGGGAGNSYYGGLQMHYAWGYGVSSYAYLLSPIQQKWAAEKGYAASGYSHAWLWGQWAADESRCWMFA